MHTCKRVLTPARGLGLLILMVVAVVPISAGDRWGREHGRNFVTILYDGPLVHDTDWKIPQGTTKNQVFRAFGGTCSMIPSDVRNTTDSASEHTTFEAERQPEGIWKMAWTDNVSGKATAATGQSYDYVYQQRVTYLGTTTDGRAPRPNRTAPSLGDDGFLQWVPGNVSADALELNDFFILQEEMGGSVVASSHVLTRWRLKITPTEPPPEFFPAVALGKYIVRSLDQLAGQLGCDPL
jgi:hypothetical protein